MYLPPDRRCGQQSPGTVRFSSRQRTRKESLHEKRHFFTAIFPFFHKKTAFTNPASSFANRKKPESDSRKNGKITGSQIFITDNVFCMSFPLISAKISQKTFSIIKALLSLWTFPSPSVRKTNYVQGFQKQKAFFMAHSRRHDHPDHHQPDCFRSR